MLPGRGVAAALNSELKSILLMSDSYSEFVPADCPLPGVPASVVDVVVIVIVYRRRGYRPRRTSYVRPPTRRIPERAGFLVVDGMAGYRPVAGSRPNIPCAVFV